MLESSKRAQQQKLTAELIESKIEVTSAKLKLEDLQVREQLPELILRAARAHQKGKLLKLLKLVDFDLPLLTLIPPTRFKRLDRDLEIVNNDSDIVAVDLVRIRDHDIIIEEEYVGQRKAQSLRLELIM